MEIKRQKADAAAQKENLCVRDDRQRLAIPIAQDLRDAGFDCEVAAPLPSTEEVRRSKAACATRFNRFRKLADAPGGNGPCLLWIKSRH